MNILATLIDKLVGTVQGPIHKADLNTSMTKLNADKGQALNWQVSIVDLLKLLDMDSSIEARHLLAIELGYTGTAADGSAEKNMWLHEAVMKKVAERGIKVPT